MFCGTERRSPTDYSGSARSFVKRLARWCPTISPRARARLLAGFLAANLALVLLPAADANHLELIDPGAEWIGQLWADSEGTWANTYSVVVWGAVAVLGLAQLLRPGPLSLRRWARVIGWLSVTLVASLIAFEDFASWKYAIGNDLMQSLPYLQAVPGLSRWVVAVAPLMAVPLLAAGWVLWSAQRGHPARQLLTGLAAVLLIGAVVQDADLVRQTPLVELFRLPPHYWAYFTEEGAEIMGGATLIVILIEVLVARPEPVPSPRRDVVGRRLAAVDVLLVASAFLLVAWHILEDSRSSIARPWSYTGPITLVEQPFRARHDYLRRIDVWAFVDSTPESAEIFARLTPEGSDVAIRESRTTVDARRHSNATAAFHFDPISDSRGKVYTLAVGILSGQLPYVFLGLTGSDVHPAGEALVSGAPTPYGDDLAMRIVSHGHFIESLLGQEPQHWLWLGEVTVHIFIWVLIVVAAWRGLSTGPKQQFWRGFFWPAAFNSALITASLVTLTLLAVVAPVQLA